MKEDFVFPQTEAVGGVLASLGGLTKREVFTLFAMHGLICNGWTDAHAIEEDSRKIADAMLRGEEE